MSVYAIIQARMGSTRLPGKILMPLGKKPAIQRVIERVSHCREIDGLCVATTNLAEDDKLYDLCVQLSVRCFRGDALNVLSRYYHAALELGACNGDYIMRVSGDCPLIDPDVCDEVIRLAKSADVDYASNNLEETYPDGLDCEVFTFETLSSMHKDAAYAFEREHVTQHAKRNPDKYTLKNLSATQTFCATQIFCTTKNFYAYRWTLDEREDYEFLRAVYDRLDDEFAGMHEIIELLSASPELCAINSHLIRNEGLIKSLAAEGLN